ncbi:MAG: vitamin K epoxide reductase family protein [Chitinophagaceae bacterium]|nr:vitamin K epoxide reductase family protein [Chitinophagaceae bacterium]
MNKLTTHLQHPNVQATDCLLRLLQVPVHSFTVEQQLEEHPDWPSLLSISDAMHQWHVPHLAAKAADQQLPDTHYPLLAITNHPERPLAVVTGVHNDAVHFYQYSYRQQHQEPLKDFLQRWTGIYLIAEATPQSGDPDYAAAASKRRWQLALPMAALLLALTALGGLCWPRLQHLTGSANLSGGGATIAATIAIFILYLAGLAVSLMLLWYDIDKRNPLLQKVCTGLVKTNCNAILNSSASKLFGWLSWSEIGFAFYAGGLLLLALPVQAPWALYWLGLLGAAALLYPVFSIYYQWRIAKQWCMLCLAVQAILILQAVALWAGHFLPQLQTATFTQFLIPNSLFLLTTAYILPLLAWLSLKPWLLRHQTALREQRAYRRLKFNPEVFTSLLHKQKAIATPTNGLGIVLGPANAPHQLVKVCNP